MEESKLTTQQYKSFGPRPVSGYGKGAAIWAHVRYDDECHNGHNSFAITGSIRDPRRKDSVACGCLHDDIAKAFPELAPFIKWHLCSSDGPMHYIANTVFFAGDRDCFGKRKGEPTNWEHTVQFGDNPIKYELQPSFAKFLQTTNGNYDLEIVRFDHDNTDRNRVILGPKFTFKGYGQKWHECPFDTEAAAADFLQALKACEPRFVEVPTAWSEGKSRELSAARDSAIWPDATDEDLTAPGLEERLKARLPALLAEFRQAVESLGFIW